MFEQTKRNKEIYQRLYDEYWGGGNVAVLKEYLDRGYEDHVLGLKSVKDWEAFMAPFRTGMPDLKFHIQHMIAEGDLVVSVWTAEATHTGDFMGKRGTGQKITFSGACTGRFKDGKLMEEWSHPDMYALMRQVGLVPEPMPA